MKASRTIEDLLSALTQDLSAQDILAADIMSDLSNAIAKQRLAMGLNQSELAKQLGKTQSTISKWENGDKDFSISLLADIAVKLGMDLNVELKARQAAKNTGAYRVATGKIIDFERARTASYSGPSFAPSTELKEM